ncbi:MAG: nicotinate phosphoribosyltransferase, partial [Oscillospiraceae bacterium]
MNYTMLTDFYEITMANGYFKKGMGDKIAYFDMYFRKAPDEAGFAIMAGVEQLIDYCKNLEFDEDDIEFLRNKNMFD